MKVSSEDSLYSNYASRQPSDLLLPILKWWHKRLLKMYAPVVTSSTKSSNFLEVGPGHGFVAAQAVSDGWTYYAIDNSPALVEKLRDQEYDVHLGEICDLLQDSRKYDVIWLSHVLEHTEDHGRARDLLANCRELLSEVGRLVIISPDILSWRHHFWEVDWSHGYQTSLRSTTQLLEDIGCRIVTSQYHRGASTNLLLRGVLVAISWIPHRAIDFLLTPKRARKGDGIMYSWKAVFGWRQIAVVAEAK